MMIRNLINLLEKTLEHTYVLHHTTRDAATRLIDNGINPSKETGPFGHGFYTVMHPSSSDDEDVILLEYRLQDDMRILDLREDSDLKLWYDAGASAHFENPHLWKLMMRHGIDGVKSGQRVCFYNPEALRFVRVYSGVVDDPLEETDTNELDEFALGGLQRCTAVTVNALLKDFHLRPILLGDVPIDHPGVIRILNSKGLAYTPVPDAAGHTVQQFANVHRMYDWYLLTPGHAMALIRGELFDAENKGPDARRLEAAFQITRR
jgi:hypothetical protein